MCCSTWSWAEASNATSRRSDRAQRDPTETTVTGPRRHGNSSRSAHVLDANRGMPTAAPSDLAWLDPTYGLAWRRVAAWRRSGRASRDPTGTAVAEPPRRAESAGAAHVVDTWVRVRAVAPSDFAALNPTYGSGARPGHRVGRIELRAIRRKPRWPIHPGTGIGRGPCRRSTRGWAHEPPRRRISLRSIRPTGLAWSPAGAVHVVDTWVGTRAVAPSDFAALDPTYGPGARPGREIGRTQV